jgi:chorismate mutase
VTRQERSYLLPRLSAADRQLLAMLPRRATLADEIAYLRLHLARSAGDEGFDDKLLMRMLELLTRMVNVQSKLGQEAGDSMEELTEIVRKRLAAGATAEEALR